MARQQTLNDQFRGTVHREAISDQITERILSLIRKHQLRPGDRLPPERELALLMGVSRATVREALRSLAMMNVVELKHGSGTFVTSLEPQLLVENFALVFSLTDNSFLQLIEAREVIEPGATALAAQRVTDEEIIQLEDILRRSWECLHNNPADFAQLDIEFHVKTAEFSRNVLLTRIMQAIAQMSIASSQRTAGEHHDVRIKRVERATRMHQGILDAIKARDPELARQRMFEHLLSVKNTLLGATVDEE
ncbi:MAG: FadR family transcriptional regulator [Chitinophagaceae bacterium]|nr:FadR family transcriptional regulator [Anaerolineae bacterium]